MAKTIRSPKVATTLTRLPDNFLEAKVALQMLTNFLSPNETFVKRLLGTTYGHKLQKTNLTALLKAKPS